MALRLRTTHLSARALLTGAFALSTIIGVAGGSALLLTAANYARAVQAVYSLRMSVGTLTAEDGQVRFAGRIRNDSAIPLRLDTLVVRFWVNGRPVAAGRLEFQGRVLAPGEGTDFTLSGQVDADYREFVRTLPPDGLSWELEGRLACYLPFGAEQFSVPLRGKWPG